MQVLDMRAATQGLPLFNRYVHIICEIVMEELATRWGSSAGFLQGGGLMSTPTRLSLQCAEVTVEKCILRDGTASRDHEASGIPLYKGSISTSTVHTHWKGRCGLASSSFRWKLDLLFAPVTKHNR